MPSKTKSQAGLMRMCAYAPSKAYKKCPPRNVSLEFARADAAQAKKNRKHWDK